MPKYLPFALLLLSTPAFAANPPYVFTPLADSTGPFNFFTNAAINNYGQVAFVATLDNSSSGIYIASTSSAPTVISRSGDLVPGTTSAVYSYGDELHLNDSATAIVDVELDSAARDIYTVTQSTNESMHVLSTQTSYGAGVSLNNDGYASFVQASNAVILSNGSTSSTIASTNPNLTIRAGSGITSINNNNVVAFSATSTSAGSAIYSTAHGTPTSVADASGPYSSFGALAENNNNLIAAQAVRDAGPNGVITVDAAGNISSIASTADGQFKSIIGPPSINDSGEVLFYANDFHSHGGLYTGPDPLADKVINAGDPLLGATVSSIHVLNQGLNNAGQIAFTANLNNGVRYILLASPASPGDANADGHIDLADLSTILNHFGATTPLWSNGNFDNAPTIDLTDLSLVLNNFGQLNPGLPNALSPTLLPAPEPTTLSLTLATTTFLITRRRNTSSPPRQ